MSLYKFNKKTDFPDAEGPPSFAESEWDKMETLLDTHLPQEKDRKRFIFWMFALLISPGLFSVYYFMHKPAKVPTESVDTTPFSKDQNKGMGTIGKAYQKTIDERIEDNRITATDKSIPPSFANNEKVNGKINFYKKNNDNVSNLSVAISRKINTDKRTRDENDMTSIFKIPSQNINTTPYPKPKMETVQTIIDTNNNNKPVLTDTNTSKTGKEQTSEKNSSKSDIKEIKDKNNFYIIFSTGLEANGTRLSSFGTVTPIYGAGLQYAIGKKIFVRAGILLTKKLYDAKDKDYNRKTGTWISSVTFDNIVAKCKVVEIPAAIGYNLINNKKTIIYAAAGTSAYFMKKEDYQFYFKTMSGNDTTRDANFTNKSNHLFSSLNLSAGIEQKINNKFSVIAEPTIKIPISGIGFGKVKLYSAGVVISAKIKLN